MRYAELIKGAVFALAISSVASAYGQASQNSTEQIHHSLKRFVGSWVYEKTDTYAWGTCAWSAVVRARLVVSQGPSTTKLPARMTTIVSSIYDGSCDGRHSANSVGREEGSISEDKETKTFKLMLENGQCTGECLGGTITLGSTRSIGRLYDADAGAKDALVIIDGASTSTGQSTGTVFIRE